MRNHNLTQLARRDDRYALATTQKGQQGRIGLKKSRIPLLHFVIP
jgi:hypothetical protein